MPESATPDPWFEEGLRFECTQCGHCCTGASGTVRVDHEEILELAESLTLEPGQFREIYTRPLSGGALSLRERASGACIFHRAGGGCEVYEHRPRQCRTWPFWRAVLASPKRWAEEALSCPGMNHGPRFDVVQIRELAGSDGTSGEFA